MQGFAGLFIFKPPFFDLAPVERIFRRYFQSCSSDDGLMLCGTGPTRPNHGRAETCIVDVVGRIHNEGDLRREIGRHNAPPDSSPSQLLSAIYQRKGIDGFDNLVGDFSFYLYDARKRELLLVRDPMGTRPLFYFVGPAYITWSTEIGPLVELTQAPVSLDEEFVAAFLCNADLVDRTPYKGILQIPPAHSGRFGASGCLLNRFWDAAIFQSGDCRSDREFENRFFNLFASAVKCRLPAKGIATAELSGGLDSTSIVRMGDHLLTSGESGCQALKTVSMIFDRSRTANEEKYIAPVEAARAAASFRILESQHPLFRFRLEERHLLPNQKLPLELIYCRMGQYLRDENSSAHFCGLGGDQVLWSRDLFYPPAHLAFGHTRMSLPAALRLWSRSEGMTYYQLFREGRLIPALPYRFRRRLDFGGLSSPQFLRQGLAAHLRERQLRVVTKVHPRHLSPLQLRKLMLLAGAVAISAGCRHREFAPVEAVFPFLDTRLVRFLMNAPADQLFRPGESRSLQRRALRSLLPEVVLNREGKRGPDEALCRALREQWEFVRGLMQDSYAAGLPGIDPTELRRSVELARCGAFHWIGALPSILCLEVWIRSRAGAALPNESAANTSSRLEPVSGPVTRDPPRC